MKLGIVAREFPPTHGGMPVLAFELASELAKCHEVTVLTRTGKGVEKPTFEQRQIICGDLHRDLVALQSVNCDVWLTLNAGYIPLAAKIDKPFICYVHGNDLLNPTVGYQRRWVNLVRRMPGCKELRARLQALLRVRDIAATAGAPSAILTNSSNTAVLVKEFTRQNAIVCPPGVGNEFFRSDRRVKNSVCRFLTVSRLRPNSRRKNVDGVLRALKLLPRDLEWQYRIVGDGEDRPMFESLAKSLGIDDRVMFLGSIEQQRLIEEYLAADLFVLASRATNRDVEGFGIAYLEANACGTPVLCSSEGGAVDAVCDGVSGIVIESSDDYAIAAGIERFLAKRSQFGPDIVRRHAERFRWPVCARRVEQAVLGVL